MIKIPTNYRKPVCVAIILHIALLIFFIVRIAPSVFRAPQALAPMQVIHATAIMKIPAQSTSEIHQQKTQQEKQTTIAAQQKQLEEKNKQKLLEKVLILHQEQLAKLQAQKKVEKIKKEKALKTLALKKQQEKIAKEKATKVALEKKLLVKQKQLQQEMMQKSLNSDQNSLTQATAQQGAVDKYKAEILSLIQSNWRIDRLNDTLRCVYSISLTPDGTVLSATLIKSSGDDNLDQSARQAIMQSSPLPVPHNPLLFNHFRQLILTLSPQGFASH